MPTAPTRRLMKTMLVVASVAMAATPAEARHGRRDTRDPGEAGDRIAALVAGASRLYALRGNRVVSFDADGGDAGRCARLEAPPFDRPHAPAAAAVDADEALHLAGLPDDDPDSTEAEDVLDDEGLTPRRRPRAAEPEPAVIARALAASPASDDVWVATSAGIYRGRGGGGCARVALAGRDVVAVAAGGGVLAAATADLLWRSDGGGGFRVAAGLPARPRVLAVVDAEHTLVAGEDDVVEIGPHGVTRLVLDHGSDALAVCGGVALALAADGVWTWRGDEPAERVGDRPPVRTITCGGAGARFIAAGAGVYASPDGAAWREQPAPFAGSAGAVAVLGDRVWLAVDGALVPLGGAAPPRSRDARAGAPPLPALPPLSTRRLIEPVLPWPQVTLVLAEQRTPLRAGWSLVVLIGFRFGRVAAGGADRRQLAAELVRRDAALAAEEQLLSYPTDDDPSRIARLRATRQEREALR